MQVPANDLLSPPPPSGDAPREDISEEPPFHEANNPDVLPRPADAVNLPLPSLNSADEAELEEVIL